MIAPLRPATSSRSTATSLLAARRVVAAVLLERPLRHQRPSVRVSNYLAWSFVAWTISVAAIYGGMSLWWGIGSR